MLDDVTLLKGFVERGCDGDFARLVERYLGLVFAAALRQAGGDAHLARDVAQSVFVDFARKAPALLHHRALAGWLYTSTLYAAAKAVRAEQRRRRRDEQAQAMLETNDDAPTDAIWTEVRPVLDEALQALNARDREAVLLRYFHGREFATIGVALNISENGARMRVERALEKLRAQLVRRGIVSTLAALGATLGAHAAVVPPAALTATVTGAALAGASSAGWITVLLNFFAMTKIQLGLVAAVATVGVVTFTVQHREQAALREMISRASAVADEPDRLRAGIVALRQTADDFRALRARADGLDQVRRATQELADRRAQLEAHVNSSARSPQPAGGSSMSSQATRTAGLDRLPQAMHKVALQYPEQLRRAGIPGEVSVSFVVDATGQVRDPKVIESTHPDFVAPALASISQWQFASGVKGGRPVNTRIQMPVIFEVPDPNWF